MKKRCYQSYSYQYINYVCPPGMPPGRYNNYLQCFYFITPYPGNIRGIDLQPIVARWQLCVIGKQLITGGYPTVVKILQPVTVTDLLRAVVFIACEFKAQEVLIISENKLVQSVQAAVSNC